MAALFHDLGHFCVNDRRVLEKLKELNCAVTHMGDVGLMNHENIGALYLQKLGNNKTYTFFFLFKKFYFRFFFYIFIFYPRFFCTFF